MTWNYRVVKYKDGSGIGLHEVYYNKAGEPYCMTEAPINFTCETDEGISDIVHCLELALKDIRKYPVLKEPEKWADADS